MRRVILPQTLRRLAPPGRQPHHPHGEDDVPRCPHRRRRSPQGWTADHDANRFNYPTASLWIYGLIFVLYFLICWPISLLSRHMEKTWQN